MATLSLEEKRKKVQDLRPIDDVFFEVLADDTDFCQEILRVILEDENLTVTDVIVQSSSRNLYGRSVRLDALCTLGNGKKANIEVQRFHNDDHAKRVRFNASVITAKESQTGTAFEDSPELYVVYISEFDIWGKGFTTYHIDNVIRETGEAVDDGLKRVFVNTAVNDGTDIASLMSCFTQKIVESSKFPVFTRRMRKLKEEEGGVTAVCDVMKKYEQIARSEGHAEGHAEGRAEERRNTICKMLSRGKTPEEIADFCGYDIAEIKAVEATLCATVS